MVSKEKQQELAIAILGIPGFRQTAYMADVIAERIVELGWVPTVPELTPEQEVDIMDRVISGLPERLLKAVNPEGNAVCRKPTNLELSIMYEKQGVTFNPPITDETWDNVQKLTTEQMGKALIEASNMWERIPEFDNYEINPLGVIRSRWTKRTLDVSEDGGQEYVDMHDKDGFSHIVNVSFVKEQVFGK